MNNTEIFNCDQITQEIFLSVLYNDTAKIVNDNNNYNSRYFANMINYHKP